MEYTKKFFKKKEFKVKAYYKNDLLDGDYKSYYANGVLAMKTSYKDGRVEGSFERYDSKGTLRTKTAFSDDLLDGKYKGFHFDGKPEIEAFFVGREPEGEYKSYYKNGNKKIVATMSNGELNGPFEVYRENGELQSKGEFKDGQFVHTEYMTDSRDGQKYPIVKIGTQTWMAADLNYNNQHLYKKEDALVACPAGWHLPSADEFKKLLGYVRGGQGRESRSGGTNLIIAYNFEKPFPDLETVDNFGGFLKPENGLYGVGREILHYKEYNLHGQDVYRSSFGYDDFIRNEFLSDYGCKDADIAAYMLMSGEFPRGYDIFGFSASSEKPSAEFWTSSKDNYYGGGQYVEIYGFRKDTGNNRKIMDPITHCLSTNLLGSAYTMSNAYRENGIVKNAVRCIADGDDKSEKKLKNLLAKK